MSFISFKTMFYQVLHYLLPSTWNAEAFFDLVHISSISTNPTQTLQESWSFIWRPWHIDLCIELLQKDLMSLSCVVLYSDLLTQQASQQDLLWGSPLCLLCLNILLTLLLACYLINFWSLGVLQMLQEILLLSKLWERLLLPHNCLPPPLLLFILRTCNTTLLLILKWVYFQS